MARLQIDLTDDLFRKVKDEAKQQGKFLAKYVEEILSRRKPIKKEVAK